MVGAKMIPLSFCPSSKALAVLQTQDALTRSIQEIGFRFASFQKDRRPNGDAAQQRNGQDFTPRQDPIDVVDVDRNQFQIRALLGHVIEPAFELTHFVIAGRSASFGKHDQRIDSPHLLQHDVDWAFVNFDFLAIDQQGIEGFGNVGLQPTGRPIVFGGHRPSDPSQLARQSGPQHDGVEVAGVVGEVNALASVGLTINPTHRESAEELR